MKLSFFCPACGTVKEAEHCFEIEKGVTVCEECVEDLEKIFRDEYEFGALADWIMKKIYETEEAVIQVVNIGESL